MQSKKQAIKLFTTMYEERTIRDRLYEINVLCHDKRELDTLNRLAMKHNAASNRAMMALYDLGWFAYRREPDYVPVLLNADRELVATWNEYSGVTTE